MSNVDIIIDVFTKAVLPDLENKLSDPAFVELLKTDPKTAATQLLEEVIVDTLKRVLIDETTILK